MIYSGYILIEGTGEEAGYEFDCDADLNPMEQLEYLLSTGLLQIIDYPPREDDEDEDY